ncbi:MAG TPA: squalene synthase HpnC [Acidimicrobiales bacterium]|nr:squalene synthase HpnC [Acidimicrobiales bacterium]
MSSRLTQTINSFFGARDEFTIKASRENFPVASRLLPREVRSQLMAIYGFARLTDDIGDEAEGDRLALLDWLDDELTLAAEGRAIHPVFQRLSPVILDLNGNLEPFRNLIEANRVDQRVTRYESFDALVGYCMLSAAPVGRLVLAVFHVATPERTEWSDQVCIALQLVEHLQDIGEDARQGRIYVPLASMREFGVAESDLLAPAANDALRALVASETQRTRDLLTAGSPLASSLPLRARLAVTGFVGGGLAAADAIERANCDVLAVACHTSTRDVLSHTARGLVRASRHRRAA